MVVYRESIPGIGRHSIFENLIAEEEGRSSTAYKDSRSYLTIGVGALIDPKVPGAGLCDAAIDAQFEHDSQSARAIAGKFPHFAELNEVRQAVLISMAFQLGDKPLHWPNFMNALESRNYRAAADAGRDTDWWRTQTPRRAEREMQMLETGSWVAR